MSKVDLNSSRRIIVTGGVGFIGSAVIRHLNDLGFHKIVIIDHLGRTDKWKNLVFKKYETIVAPDKLFEWLETEDPQSIQGWIHLGACSSTVERDADYLLNNNYHFSVRLAEYALKNQHRFVYASSAATYGDGSKGFLDNHEDLEKLEPLNMYGYSKHLFDLWIKERGALDQVVGLKYFNVFGPNEYHKERMASAVFKFSPTILQTGKVQLFQSSVPQEFADGDQKRDFVYIKDAVRMTCDFLTSDHTGIYNIGSGIANSWNTLATAVFEALEKPIQIEYTPMPEDLLGKYQNYTRAPMEKAQAVLGKSTGCIPLKESVQDYVCNYLLKEKLW